MMREKGRLMKSRIMIVGMGPGKKECMTQEVWEALKGSDLIIGYTVYVELIKAYLPDKEFLTTPMRQEIERCRMCFEEAAKGKQVALVCSGDAGVYGLAAPMFALWDEYRKKPEYENMELEVLPGITAANSGAALLGAPLCHDYCVISLSDLLTPWEAIEKRLRAAILGDFAIAIYNPSSHKRKDYLRRACDVMLDAGAEKNRACGYVRNIGREGTECHVMTLVELRETPVDMFTTVFVGNSQSEIFDDKLITKRGYAI